MVERGEHRHLQFRETGKVRAAAGLADGQKAEGEEGGGKDKEEEGKEERDCKQLQ